MVERTEERRPVNIDKDLLAILCCPDTKQDVSLADGSLIAKLNEAVSLGQLKNKANKPITEPLDGGLIRSDRRFCILFEKTFLSCSSKKESPWKG